MACEMSTTCIVHSKVTLSFSCSWNSSGQIRSSLLIPGCNQEHIWVETAHTWMYDHSHIHSDFSSFAFFCHIYDYPLPYFFQISCVHFLKPSSYEKWLSVNCSRCPECSADPFSPSLRFQPPCVSQAPWSISAIKPIPEVTTIFDVSCIYNSLTNEFILEVKGDSCTAGAPSQTPN